MKGFAALLLLSLLMAVGCRPKASIRSPLDLPEARLIRALPLETPVPLEPSGLTIRRGTFFTVADKIDDTIFRVEWEQQAARLVPHLRFTPPERGKMDWEGITCDPEGTFYLLSERKGRLARIPPTGDAEWISTDLRPGGRDLGLFRKRNAGFEGLARLGGGHWLGAVEREPRGLVEWTGEGQTALYGLHLDSPFKAALPLLRLPDYSALHRDPASGKIFALFRNAHLIVELQKTGDTWSEKQAWSYRHIETDPRWAYQAQSYGQAEGLVVEGNTATLVFDNNLGGRQSDPGDNRPLLVQAELLPAP